MVTETGFRFLFHLREFRSDHITYACQLGTQQTRRRKQRQKTNPSLVEPFSRRRHQSEIRISTRFLIILKNNKHEDIVHITYYFIRPMKTFLHANSEEKASGALRKSVIFVSKKGFPCTLSLLLNLFLDFRSS